MTTTTITPGLKGLLRRVKLSKTLDTLPDRLTLARQSKLTHVEFLELVLADEVDRRNRQSTALRATTAKLDPTMTLEAWDPDTVVIYDQAMWAELTSLRLAALADPLLAQSAIDRLQSCAWELIVEGESYRRRQKPTLTATMTTGNKAPR